MNFLRKLLRNVFSTDTASTRRPLLARPRLETMETRLVPATASASLHAVALPSSTPTSAAFTVNPVDHSFYEITPSKAVVKLAGPNVVTDFSVGTTSNGHEHVIAHYNGTLSEYDPANGWHSLNQPFAMSSFAAVDGGRGYFVAGDLSLWSYSPPSIIVTGGHTTQVGGWKAISGANVATSVDAVTQSNGTDAIFIQGFNGNLQKYDPTTKTVQDFAAGGYYSNFAAGLDAQGNAEAYYVYSNGYGSSQLDCFHPGVTTSVVATVDKLSILSATHDGHVFATVNLGAYSFKDTTASTGTYVNVYNPSAISAATVNDYYTVASGSLVETTNLIFGAKITRTFGAPAGTSHW